MPTGNRDHKEVITYGLYDRSNMEDFSRWVAYSEVGGVFSTLTHAETSKKVLQYTDGSVWGALLHFRNKAQAPLYRQYVSTIVTDNNLSTGRGSAVGPAVLLKQNGAGLAPDGYYLFTRYNGGSPRLTIYSVKTAGTVKTMLLDKVVEVHVGDIITLYFEETNPVGPVHELSAYLNGVLQETIVVSPGIHLWAEARVAGIGGSGTGYTRPYHWTPKWWVNGV